MSASAVVVVCRLCSPSATKGTTTYCARCTVAPDPNRRPWVPAPIPEQPRPADQRSRCGTCGELGPCADGECMACRAAPVVEGRRAA